MGDHHIEGFSTRWGTITSKGGHHTERDKHIADIAAMKHIAKKDERAQRAHAEHAEGRPHERGHHTHDEGPERLHE